MKKKMGRPTKVTKRDRRKIVLSLLRLRRTELDFTSQRIQLDAGVMHLPFRTLRRVINQEGYFHLQSMKKGLTSIKDKKRRVAFAHKMLKCYEVDVWRKDINFYLDGVGFVHKTNPQDQAIAPRGLVWRRKTEGLGQGCTSKGKKAGHGGEVANLVVGISCGRGTLTCEPYKRMNGSYFEKFIADNFDETFEKCGAVDYKLFMYEGGPKPKQ